jgi:hypothetical protein
MVKKFMDAVFQQTHQFFILCGLASKTLRPFAELIFLPQRTQSFTQQISKERFH